MWEQMMAFLKSFFIYPGLNWDLMLIAIGLALVFGAIWLCTYWPPLFKKHWLWAVAVVSAFLALAAVAFVQIPLQTWASEAMGHFWSQETVLDWLLLAGIPAVLISGLVQEGAKMVPMVFWWWRSGRNIDPRLGLAIGAVAGAAFGIFEAFWAHGRMFAAGWTVSAIQTDGFIGIAGFWERLFAVGFHIAASALVGYGLAKGKGWQFYLIAAALHGLLNYGAVVFQYAYFKIGFYGLVQLEVYVAVLVVIIAAIVLLLRWQRREDENGGAAEEAVEPTGLDI
jgi:hypothetical protein